MKKILLAVFISVLAGCSVFNIASKSDKKNRMAVFNVEKDVIFHQQKPFAKLQAVTWSLDNGELVKEMNFKLLNDINEKELQVIGDMIDFLADRHQGEEIEVEFEIENGSQQFKL